MFQKKFCDIGLGTVHSKAAAAATAKAENERERNFVNICHLGLHFVYDLCCMPLYLDFPLLCMSHSLCIPTYLVSIVSPLPFPINVYLILSVYLSHWTLCLPIPTYIVIIAFFCVPTPKLASIAFLSMYLPLTITFYLYLYLGS